MPVIKQNTIQITNVIHGRFRHPLVSFTLTIALPNNSYPDGTRAFILTLKECVAKCYRRWETRDNPNGWRWSGPIKHQTKTEMYSCVFMSEDLQQAVLGLLMREGHLTVAESYNKEWFNARWRVHSEDETDGILLK